MKLETVKLSELIMPDYNPRTITPEAMESLKTSLKEFNYIDPLIINRVNNHIVGGNQRYLALKQLGYTEIPVIFIDEPDINREKAINIRLNNSSGEWDTEALQNILTELELEEIDITLTGFNDITLENMNITPSEEDYTKGKLVDWYDNNGENIGILNDKYIVPPFSVFNTNMGYWDDRKKYWDNLIGDKGQSRPNLISEGMGTSLLNSTLAEVITHWFTPYKKSKVFDTFAGDTVFGYVSSSLGHDFTGIELRQEQCDLNNERVQKVNQNSIYYCDDGQNVLNHIEEDSQDLFFSCPPYYDLEVYSDLPNDASNQETYEDFYKILDTAFTDAIKCLKDDRFAVIVCGDIRDKQGFYYGFPYDIINTFTSNGMNLYNEIVLYNKIGTGRMRADMSMKNRKVVKTHQNVYCFYKGNPKDIQEHYPKITGEE